MCGKGMLVNTDKGKGKLVNAMSVARNFASCSPELQAVEFNKDVEACFRPRTQGSGLNLSRPRASVSVRACVFQRRKLKKCVLFKIISVNQKAFQTSFFGTEELRMLGVVLLPLDKDSFLDF